MNRKTARRRKRSLTRFESLENRTLLTGTAFSEALPISPVRQPPTGFPIGLHDFDSDGDLDIATLTNERGPSGPYEGRIRWFINTNGRGDFKANDQDVRFSTDRSGVEPTFLDLDGDGDQDVMYHDFDSALEENHLYWSRNDEGNFAPWTQLTTNGLIDYRLLADMNSDGHLEIVGIVPDGSAISFREIVDGAHHRVATFEFPKSEVASFFRVADVEGDGDNDIFVTFNAPGSSHYSTSLLKNLGDFEFSLVELAPTQRIDNLADLDNDGDIDGLIVGTSEIVWLENTGEDQWLPKIIARNDDAHYGNSKTVDYDLDGDLDLAVDAGYGYIAMFRNDDGQFRRPAAPVEYNRGSLKGDIDGDGDIDEVYLLHDEEILELRINRPGQGAARLKVTAPPEPFESRLTSISGELDAKDLDGDSDLDLLVGQYWYENLGAGKFSGLKVLSKYRATFADVDGDGMVDRIIPNNASSDGLTRILFDWYPNQNGTFGDRIRVTLDESFPRVSDRLRGTYFDFDSDGDIDAWFRGQDNGARRSIVLTNDGTGNFTGAMLAPDQEPPWDGKMVDINNDGINDLLNFWDVSNRGELRWFENDETGSYGPSQKITGNVEWFQIADVNGDGWTDAVVTKQYTDRVFLEWHLNSERGFQRPIRNELAPETNFIFHLADHDEDGLWEVITSHPQQGLILREFSLDQIVPETIFADLKSIAYAYSSADFDGDGRVDLAVQTASAMHWHQNLGAANFVSPPDIDSITQAIREGNADAAFDLDNNGVVDESDRDHLIEDLLATTKGDANLDGTVAFDDFLALSNKFGQRGTWADGDFDGNGKIDFTDFLLLSENFGFTKS